MSTKSQISIIGGGNSTHTLIPLLSDAGHSVNLLTRHPDKWSDVVTVSYVLPDGMPQASPRARPVWSESRPHTVCDRTNTSTEACEAAPAWTGRDIEASYIPRNERT
jgi:hypothetical protein